MNRLLLLVGLAIVSIVSIVLLWPGAESGSSAESQTVQQLQELERHRLTALVDADVDVLERLHTGDFELVPPPGAPLSREEYLGLVAAGELDYQVFEPLTDIEVQLHGDSATLWYRSRIDIVAAGQGRFAHEAWHLYLYEKHDGQWQVAREQATAVGGWPPSV